MGIRSPRRMTATLMMIALFACFLSIIPTVHAASCPPCPACACAHGAPAFSGVLNLGGATANPDHFSAADGAMTCPMVQLQFKVKHVGPLNFSGEVRHAFCNADKRELYNKSRYCAGVELPINTTTVLFCNYERYYRQNDDWAWVGVSFRFGA